MVTVAQIGKPIPNAKPVATLREGDRLGPGLYSAVSTFTFRPDPRDPSSQIAHVEYAHIKLLNFVNTLFDRLKAEDPTIPMAWRFHYGRLEHRPDQPSDNTTIEVQFEITDTTRAAGPLAWLVSWFLKIVGFALAAVFLGIAAYKIIVYILKITATTLFGPEAGAWVEKNAPLILALIGLAIVGAYIQRYPVPGIIILTLLALAIAYQFYKQRKEKEGQKQKEVPRAP